MKKKAVGAGRQAAGKMSPTQKNPNPNLNAQARKVLGQHYRAKYGVK